MIQLMHNGLEWADEHCKQTKEKYGTLKGYDTIMDLVEAYVAGAQYVQSQLKNVKAKLRENSLKEDTIESVEQGLVKIKNEDVFNTYNEAIKLIDEIIKL